MKWKQLFAWVYFITGIISLVGIVGILMIAAIFQMWHPFLYLFIINIPLSVPYIFIMYDYLKLTKGL